MTLQKAAEVHAQIARKELESARLMVELSKSLAIQGLWPEAFKLAPGGRVTSRWNRSGYHLVLRVMVWGPERPGGRALIEARNFERRAVPAVLDNELATAEARERARASGRLKAFDARKI